LVDDRRETTSVREWPEISQKIDHGVPQSDREIPAQTNWPIAIWLAAGARDVSRLAAICGMMGYQTISPREDHRAPKA
jgi:hypothetical protein